MKKNARAQNPHVQLPTRVEAALQRYRKNQRQSADRNSAWQWKLCKWDLFALPINCKEYDSDGRAARVIRFGDLVQQPGQLILLTGSPGCGKTTACRRLVAKPPRNMVPVNISKLESVTKASIFKFLSKTFGVGSRSLMDRIERTGRLFFIVDGLGERKDVEAVVKSLGVLTRQLSHSKFIVTCRNGDYRKGWLPRFMRWNIQKLSPESQDDFIRTQPRILQRRFQKAFSTDGHFREILSNQFLLLLAAKLMAEPRDNEFTLTKLGIYRKFLDSFLTGWEKVKRGQRDFIVRLLQEIAVEMRKANRLRSHLDEEAVSVLIHVHLRDESGDEPSDKDVHETLHELYRHGLIAKEGELVRFFQETFQEFLCARWLRDQHVLPIQFSKQDDAIWFRDVQINDVIFGFYDELIGNAKLPGSPAVARTGTTGPKTNKPAVRFKIALSFPGEHRPFVRQIANHLALQIGRNDVLYDKYHEAEFARPDLDTYLPNLYRTQSELIAIFLCADYFKKQWCRLEWRFIRQLIATSEERRIMFLSFDNIGAVPEIGILDGDGYVAIEKRTPQVIAGVILERLRQTIGANFGIAAQAPVEPALER